MRLVISKIPDVTKSNIVESKQILTTKTNDYVLISITGEDKIPDVSIP